MADEPIILQINKVDRRKYMAALFAIVVAALIVRSLTGYFIREHFEDPAWFQFGSYKVFDRNAQDILDGNTPAFWIDDNTRTDRISYPPGFPLWMAAIYGASGDRSAGTIQRIQLVLDSFAVLLLVGIGVTAFGWKTGIITGFMGALSPLLAISGVTPTADAPTSWFVLGGSWCLLLAAKRRHFAYAVAAGALLGVACWFRVNPLFLAVAWSAAIFIFLGGEWRQRLLLSSAVTLATLLVISPVIVRNVVVFYPEIAPTGLNVGWNLLAGIGETEKGSELGVPCCDADIVEQDREAMRLSADAPLALNYPDGIKRDRERGRRAVSIIAANPVWFAGVMANRIWGHLKIAGEPVPSVGTAGFNVTAEKTLGPGLQGGVIAAAVTGIGMLQSVLRYLALPLTILGLIVAFRLNRLSTWLLLSTIIYYLATLAIGHSEIRYGLPMQATMIIFSGLAINFCFRLPQ